MPEPEGLFAGVAWGDCEVGAGSRVKGIDEVTGDAIDLGRVADPGGIDREEELREAGLLERVGGDLVGSASAGEGGGEEVEGKGEAGALPEADGEGAKGLLDGGGVLGEVAGSVVSAGDGELISAAGVAGELAVGELAHGHIEDDVGGAGVAAARERAGDGEDERVVAEGGGGGAPGGEVAAGVGPADGEQPLIGGVPAVASATHPVVGVGECDGSDAMLAGECDGALDGVLGVEIADAAVSVPALDGSRGGYERGRGVNVDAAVADHGGEAREAVEAVRLDAVARAFGEDAGAARGSLRPEAEVEGGLGESVNELGEEDARHGAMVLLWWPAILERTSSPGDRDG